MAIYSVANGTQAAGSSTYTITFLTGTGSLQLPAVGDLIYVVVGHGSNPLISSVVDSQGQTYTSQVAVNSGSTTGASLYSVLNTKTLTGADTITITFSATGGVKYAVVKGCDGISSATVDKSSTGTGTSTAPSSGSSGLLTQPAELVVGCVIHNATDTPTAFSFGGSSETPLQAGTSQLSEFDELVFSTSGVTASCTISTSIAWGALIGTFKLTAPSITTSSLPNGTVGTAYSQTLAESGGTSAFTWSMFSGSLPTGLSLSSAGVISGTPSSAGTSSFLVEVTDGIGQTATQSLSITIVAVFPAVILDLQADMLINGAWTSITPNVYSERTKPTITRGRPDGSSQANPSTAAFQLNNQSSKFNPYNPLGTYYGQINRNTPLRFHVPEPTNYARFEDDNTSSWTAGNKTFAGNMTAIVDMNLSNWTSTCLVSQCGSVTNISWGFLLNADGTLAFLRSTDGINTTTFTSSQPLPASLIGTRFTVKAVYNSSTASVTFSYATAGISGPFTTLGSVQTNSSGVLFATSANLTVGYNSYFGTLGGINGGFDAGAGVTFAPAAYMAPNGKIYEVQVKAGSSLVADAIFSGQANGTTSFSDAQSNSWSANGTTSVSSRKFRFHGEMSDWPQRWDVTGNDVYVDVVANGQLRRAQIGNNPVQSALTRAWLNDFTGAYAPVAYWPCEDGTGATQIASGLSSSTPFVATPMTINTTRDKNNPTSFASNSNFFCTNPLPVPNKDSWVGSLPFYKLPASPAIVVTFLLSIPSGGDTNNITMIQLPTGGDVNFALLNYDTGSSGELQFVGQDQSGNNLFSSTKITGVNGQNMLVQLVLNTNLANTIYTMNVLNLGQNSATSVQGTLTSTSTRHLRQVYINPNNATMSSAVGQIAVQTTYGRFDVLTQPTNMLGPFNAWAGETAGLRFARLCNEQGFNYRVVGYPSTSVVMGPQTPQTFMQLLQECEDADHGMIFEPRTGLGLGYVCYNALVNQAANVAFSYTSAQLGGGGGMSIQPFLDDLLTANDWIVTTAASGSSVEIIAVDATYSATAALSAQNVPNGVGVYQNSATINVWDDFQLYDQAGWLTHMGTVNEYRYPAVPVDLARSEVASLYNAIQDIDLGDYIQITTPPTWLTYDTIKGIVWGTTEMLGGYIFTEQFNTQPESPLETLVAGTGATSDNRADTDGSTLHTTVNSSATSLSVTTSSGGILWTTTGGDFPFDIIVDGERMTVTNVTGASSPQTFTVTRSVNGVVKGHTHGVAINIFNPVYAALV